MSNRPKGIGRNREGKFIVGNTGGGRPKGSRNKLGEEFISALQHDFMKHGDEVIAKVRDERPDQYLKVIASILPKELNVNTNAANELSDDQLSSLLDAARGHLEATRSDTREGTNPPTKH